MRKFLSATLLSASLALGASAAPAAVVDSVGDNFTIFYDGFTGTPSGTIAGLSANIAFAVTGIGGGGTAWTFSYTISNTSGFPVTASRLSNFGFNTNPDVSGASVTGVFDAVVFGANQPNQVGVVEVCFTAQNCPGGGSGGVTQGNSGGGTFTLNFASAADELTLSDFFIRWQALTYPGVTGGSGSGFQTGCEGPNCEDRNVPEPGTLALLGLGAIGFALRRRRLA